MRRLGFFSLLAIFLAAALPANAVTYRLEATATLQSVDFFKVLDYTDEFNDETGTVGPVEVNLVLAGDDVLALGRISRESSGTFEFQMGANGEALIDRSSCTGMMWAFCSYVDPTKLTYNYLSGELSGFWGYFGGGGVLSSALLYVETDEWPWFELDGRSYWAQHVMYYYDLESSVVVAHFPLPASISFFAIFLTLPGLGLWRRGSPSRLARCALRGAKPGTRDQSEDGREVA
ncbi:hypothetical protein EV657_1313 [Rhodovulum visakhapatnamense]|uniref:Secreted protein n=2 Tax=Rhodovulum visakhapatnamense TaxID=364297 RepID=A0A4R8FJ70_9RHOB|nr:hypothetical protein EV657_1313 [Rhodovulum visakhapatnamense]